MTLKTHEHGAFHYPQQKHHNILLVVIDNLRPDLACYGYDRNTMPQLEKRLASATLFLNCHSPVGWTLPSCASIITGLTPDQHGVHDHRKKFKHPKLGHFLGKSYQKVGITNNGNMVSDFITKEYLKSIGHLRRPKVWNFFDWDSGFDRYSWTHKEDHQTPFHELEHFLRSPGPRPYFMFFHTNIVHDYNLDKPYYVTMPEWLNEELHPDLWGFRDGPHIWKTPPGGLSRDQLKNQLKARYDSGIRHTDAKLDEMFKHVDFSDTIVVLVSDHGEGFDPDHGRVHHTGRLHNDLTHVPLAIWLPPNLREQVKAKALESHTCSTIDIVPTLLKLIGKQTDPFSGHFLFDLPPHRSLSGCDRGYIYWDHQFVRESYKERSIEIRSTMKYPLKTIVMHRDSEKKSAVYNLAYDPHEYRNLLEPRRGSSINFQPVSFLVLAGDAQELRGNLLASPIARSPHHQWIFIGVEGKSDVSIQLNEKLKQARHRLVFIVHHDVYLPHGWEEQVFRSLADLEEKDPDWGIIGPAGAPSQSPQSSEYTVGHWCNPSGYHRRGNLPHQGPVDHKMWVGIRNNRGIHFESSPANPNDYAISLLNDGNIHKAKSYVIDAFTWLKYHEVKD